jgi:hypothetical protein
MAALAACFGWLSKRRFFDASENIDSPGVLGIALPSNGRAHMRQGVHFPASERLL